jgi:cell division protein FtsI (penicillin-binding protein 3)
MGRHVCLGAEVLAANTTNVTAMRRLYWLGAVMVAWVLVICLRLFYLQVFSYTSFEQRATRQQQRSFETAPKRGIIYDRNGNELALSTLVDSVYVVPADLPDQATTAALLGRVTATDARELLTCFRTKPFCWVARKPDPGMADRLRSLNLKGVYFQKEPKRFYPKKELAAQVLGYVGMDDQGLSGVERVLNTQLGGQPGRMSLSVDARRKTFARVESEPEPGASAVLTLDEKIQYIAERELERAMQETHAASGTVLVENPHTGEILALANRPTFNPNNSREIANETLKNHAVSDVYEPGSTFKIVTISAALEEKLISPDEVFDCQMGSINVGGLRIRDHKAFGLLPVSGIMTHSSDVGAIKIALRLGEERFYKYIRAYGLGQQTGIELPGETRGLTKPVNRWSKVSIGAISMGQEIGISPLQLAAMVSTIANDGVMVPPRVVAATMEPRRTPQQFVFEPVSQRRVISTLTAAQMKQMLAGVVLEGTGKKALLSGYSSAGKTGTAQKADPATGGYSKTKYIASFAGFAPVNNPAVTVAVILDSPVGPHQGGQVAAPVFQRITQQVLGYLNVPHDVPVPTTQQLLLAARKTKAEDLAEGSPDRLGTLPELMEAENADALPASVSAHPAGRLLHAALVEREQPAAPAASVPPPVVPASLPKSGTVVLDVEQGGVVVPSFLGMHLRGAVELAEESNLELQAVGSGAASEQSPAAGSHVPAGTRITVRFAR